jgi:hypothetical protein
MSPSSFHHNTPVDVGSVKEKAEYLATTRDKGNKRVDFMFVH